MQTGDHSFGVLLEDEADDQRDERQAVFDVHADEIARCKAGSVADVRGEAVGLFDDLAYDGDPDKYFHKAQEGGQVALTARDEDDTHGAEGHVEDERGEDEQG